MVSRGRITNTNGIGIHVSRALERSMSNRRTVFWIEQAHGSLALLIQTLDLSV